MSDNMLMATLGIATELQDKVDELEAINAELLAALVSIRVHIWTLEFDALGIDQEAGYSYRDEMVANIDNVLAKAEATP